MLPKPTTSRGRPARARRRLRGRPLARTLLRAVLALGLVAGASLATADAASASGGLHEQVCGGQAGRYTVCLYITDDPQSPYSHYYKVHVGIDVTMSQSDAQNIIDGGGAISARMYGADAVFDDNLQGVTRSWWSAWEGGLSAEFDRSISGGVLDEDPEGVDEVYARVSLYVPSSGVTRYFNSPEVEASFWGGPLGP
jgi:hypothetical protein